MELIYARWLAVCTGTALAVLVAGFGAYVFGVLEPAIALAQLPAAWRLPLAEFLAATGAPTGWQWLRWAAKGDYANFVGIAMLGTVTIVCYLRVLPPLYRASPLLAVLAACQVAVLLLAASGLLAASH